MTKANTKKIKDPLAKARGKCDYDHEVARRLRCAYQVSAGNLEKFRKIGKLFRLTDEEIALGDPQKRAETCEEIRARFFGRMSFLYGEKEINEIWQALEKTGHLEDPDFIYAVTKNDLDMSEVFFPCIAKFHETRDAFCGGETDPLYNPSFSGLGDDLSLSFAPWGYVPSVSIGEAPWVMSTNDPFYHLVATDPFFCSTAGLSVATLRLLEERNVLEYFIPDAWYLPAFLTTGFSLEEKCINLALELDYRSVYAVYRNANPNGLSEDAFKKRFCLKSLLDTTIAHQSIRFIEGQVLFYEFPFALSEYDLATAVHHRLKLLHPGAILTFSVRHSCPSNEHWLDIFGCNGQNALFSSTRMHAGGVPVTASEVVEAAIASTPGVFKLETIETRDDKDNLVASQFIVTCEKSAQARYGATHAQRIRPSAARAPQREPELTVAAIR